MKRATSPPPRIDARLVAAVRDALVGWYRSNARDLPWRRDPSPYRVWVSELMLQQTRVETVVPYFERFLGRFPDYRRLAAASEEEVLEAWSGLGYYRRARSLREGARAVLERHGGEFPPGEQEALALPGVGPYTAGAVRSIALGIRAPILDGNVTRVLSRVFGIDGDVSRAPVRRLLWSLAERVVEQGEPGEVNQAQMELGALLCRPADPLCGSCPLGDLCVARRDRRTGEIPRLPAKRGTVEISRCVLLVRRKGEVLLRRRRESELSPGLWDLPGAFTGDERRAAATDGDAARLVPFRLEFGDPLGAVRHAVTHRRITLHVREARPARGTRSSAPAGPDGAELTWCTPEAALAKALPSPARRILARFAAPA
ncbi:MAG: A/G-specific adenine glycosylase [Candidatus Eiseniibacteriota bacterium]